MWFTDVFSYWGCIFSIGIRNGALQKCHLA